MKDELVKAIGDRDRENGGMVVTVEKQNNTVLVKH